MTNLEKVRQLRGIVIKALDQLIDRDYWLLEVPYYSNVGDTLIWQGELDYLSRLPYRCKGVYSFNSRRQADIPDGDLILLQGGGNLGDIYREPNDYRKKIISEHPHSHVIILPQTVFWQDETNYCADAEFFSRHDCTICVRDHKSFECLSRKFTNKLLLLPDMAFCIDSERFKCTRCFKRPLLLKRIDCELKEGLLLKERESSKRYDVTDWIPITAPMGWRLWERRIRRLISVFPRVYDWYMQCIIRRYHFASGVALISGRKEVCTTRLHACILSILMGVERIEVVDNSYGKNSSFYETWLSDCENVKMVS